MNMLSSFFTKKYDVLFLTIRLIFLYSWFSISDFPTCSPSTWAVPPRRARERVDGGRSRPKSSVSQHEESRPPRAATRQHRVVSRPSECRVGILRPRLAGAESVHRTRFGGRKLMEKRFVDPPTAAILLAATPAGILASSARMFASGRYRWPTTDYRVPTTFV